MGAVFLESDRDSLAIGTAVGAVGEAIRIWAAGHLEKSREVTTSGPYRFTRHPLYLGSSILGLGVAIASRSLIVALLMFAYMAATITAAIRTEEAFLRQQFGDATTLTLGRAGRRRSGVSVSSAPGAIASTAPSPALRCFVVLLVARMWLGSTA